MGTPGGLSREMMGCCGFNCNACPAYTENLCTRADQERAAQAWSSYFGVTVPVEMARCRGCRSEDREGWDYPDHLCELRQCVLDRGLESCAECPEFPCPQWSRRCGRLEAVLAHWKPFLTQEEFEQFLEPYDARANLECLRHGAVPGGD